MMTGKPASAKPLQEAQIFQKLAGNIPRNLVPATLIVLIVVFAIAAPGFFTADNLVSVANQNALLLLATVAMTVVVRAGGIDLSIGVAIDLAALTASSLLRDDYLTWVALTGGLIVGATVGLVNAFLIVVLRIRPFLATISVWFIGASLQQVFTEGGAPVYLSAGTTPGDFLALGGPLLWNIGFPLVAALLVLVLTWVLLERSRWGKVLTSAGQQLTATKLSGRFAGTSLFFAYLLAGAIAAVAGILLAARSNGFVANSGQLYVMDSIGAVFIGATLSRFGRPNLLGSLLGVAVFALLTNGLNLIGLSFHWQGLARGAVLIVLLLLAALLAQPGRLRLPRLRRSSAGA